MAAVQPDIIAFQEIFWAGDCEGVPEDSRTGFFCEGWAPGEPTVVEAVLGSDYQIACHLGKPDKCLGVRTSFATIAGCDSALCLDGLAGGEVEGCGSGSRVGRATLNRMDGDPLTLVSVHGSSGLSPDDQACRVAQVAQVFDDLGDGRPALHGASNLLLGDLNTDPGRMTEADPSAAAWRDGAEEVGLRWITSIDPEDTPTYSGLVSIDHVAADRLDGSCWHAGLDDEHAAVFEGTYFDHLPAVCTVKPR